MAVAIRWRMRLSVLPMARYEDNVSPGTSARSRPKVSFPSSIRPSSAWAVNSSRSVGAWCLVGSQGPVGVGDRLLVTIVRNKALPVSKSKK